MKNYIYVVGGLNGPVKIGMTTNPKARLATLKTASPINLEMIAIFETDMTSSDLERTVHFVLRKKRLNGEWFDMLPNEAVYHLRKISSVADGLLSDVTNLMSNKIRQLKPLTDEEEAQIQKQIASDPDAPELTDEELAQARPFREVFPDLAAKIEEERAKRGRPNKDKTKTQVTLRLDPEVVERYRATGKGWQSKMNKDLRKAVGL